MNPTTMKLTRKIARISLRNWSEFSSDCCSVTWPRWKLQWSLSTRSFVRSFGRLAQVAVNLFGVLNQLFARQFSTIPRVNASLLLHEIHVPFRRYCTVDFCKCLWPALSTTACKTLSRRTHLSLQKWAGKYSCLTGNLSVHHPLTGVNYTRK